MKARSRAVSRSESAVSGVSRRARSGETVIEFPNNHLGYAYTWYGFAIVAVLMLGYWIWRERKPA